MLANRATATGSLTLLLGLGVLTAASQSDFRLAEPELFLKTQRQPPAAKPAVVGKGALGRVAAGAGVAQLKPVPPVR
jgi:hypothetical protein